jgi:NADPH-dependent curcumin reductase CurA
MTSATARQIVLASRPTGGRAALADFRLEEVPMPVPDKGQVLLRIDYLSLDPYMRGRMNEARSYAKPAQLDEAMPGESVATVIESNDTTLPAGAQVLVNAGWVSHAVFDAGDLSPLSADGIATRAYLGVLGMPGFTAYAGMAAIGKPKSGETVVVGAASGPVGSLVGQLAKIAGARVVGIAGGAKKCGYVVDELGFDAAIDHRAPDFADQLATACPKGIDVYFENIGGAVWKAVLPLLNQYGRVPVCGLMAQTSGKNADADDGLAATMRAILTRSLTVRGYINYEFLSEYREAFLRDVGGYLRAGQVQHLEDVTVGLENAPQAFLDMIDGLNFGKVLVRVSDEAKA